MSGLDRLHPADDTTGPGADWQRLHPLSPFVRGGVVLLAAGGYAVSQVVDGVFGSLDPTGTMGDTGPIDDVRLAVAERPLIAALLAVVVVALAGLSWLNWRLTRFRIAGGQIEHHSGVLFRQQRQVPLERVQAVETTRPLLARLLGLSQVVVQSAGGSDSHLTLAFLSAGRAEEVRAHLLELAGHSDEPGRPGADLPASGTVADAGERPLVTVPNGRLFVATLLHPASIALGAIAFVGVVVFALLQVDLSALAGAPALVPVVLGLVVNRAKELLVHGNFSIARSATAVRVRHGLTDLRVSSVPVHRVQAVEVRQSLWWRRFGWWQVRVNVAGVRGDEQGNDTTLLPVGTATEAMEVLAALGVRSDDPFVLSAMGPGARTGDWIGPPRAARFFRPWSWRYTGVAASAAAVFIREGRWTRRLVIVPHARVQSLTLDQGPLDARLALAAMSLHTTRGPVKATVRHLSTREAETFFAVETECARGARRRSVPTRPAEPLAPRTPPLMDYPH